MHSEDKLGKEKIGKLIWIMSIPAIVAQIINLLYSVVDRIYIGHLTNGENALAGIGIASSVLILVSALSQLVGGGGAPLAAKALGQGNKKKAEQILGNGFIMLIFLGVLSGLLIYSFRKPLLSFCGASINTYEASDSYLSIYLIGTCFVLISLGLNPFIICQGKTKAAMLSIAIGAILNISLDPLFIFGFSLGVKGAAIATIISQFVSAIFELSILFNKNTSLRIKKEHLKINWKIIGEICALGISPFIMSSTECIIGVVFNRNLAFYGDSYVSCLTVMQSAMMIVSTPISGFTSGISPIISYNYGAGDRERVISTLKKEFLIFVSFCTTLTIIMIIFPRFVGSIFTNSTVVLDLVEIYLPIFMFGMLIFGLQRACQTSFLALGQAKISIFIAILRKIILLIPLVYFFQKVVNLGVIGVYLAEPVADCISAITCTIIFLIKIKKILNSIPLRKNENIN